MLCNADIRCDKINVPLVHVRITVQNLVILAADGIISFVRQAAAVIVKTDTMMLDIALIHHHLIQFRIIRFYEITATFFTVILKMDGHFVN